MIYQSTALHFDKQSCHIYVGENLLSQPDVLIPHITGHQVMIVTQDTIAEHYLKPLQALLSDYQCDVITLPQGEQYKTIEQWLKILDALIAHNHERSTTLIALGGGMIGDITGFAAACYQRGTNFIQIPTSLVAQVDAAIGGKTAVNHATGKNKMGVIYQPSCVISDVNFLKTLPEREFIAGLAEVIKYGLVCDATFFVWLEKNMSALLAKENKTLQHAIATCAALKAQVVQQDEKDLGLRHILNLGHTFGHALETANEYQVILHGEAVAIGIALATKLSAELGWLTSKDVTRILQLLAQANLVKTVFDFPSAADFIRTMRQDKKIHAGKLNLILLKSIGVAVKTSQVSEAQLMSFLENEKKRGVISE